MLWFHTEAKCICILHIDAFAYPCFCWNSPCDFYSSKHLVGLFKLINCLRCIHKCWDFTLGLCAVKQVWVAISACWIKDLWLLTFLCPMTPLLPAVPMLTTCVVLTSVFETSPATQEHEQRSSLNVPWLFLSLPPSVSDLQFNLCTREHSDTDNSVIKDMTWLSPSTFWSRLSLSASLAVQMTVVIQHRHGWSYRAETLLFDDTVSHNLDNM